MIPVVLAVLMLAPACSVSFGPPPSLCVPGLRVEPEGPRPGDLVTVTPDQNCPVPEGTEWTIRIQPEDARVPLSEATVRPDADGSFALKITVPATIAPGRALVWITNYWDTAECPDGASCVSAEGYFTVEP